MNNQQYILSIGYGNRSIDDFINILINQQIRYLIDLRSSPFSKFRPEYNRDNLEKVLKAKQLKYVFMGDAIGGLPKDRTCYTDDQVDYDKVKGKSFYQDGIGRLIKAFNGNYSVAIMCSEGKPEMCHRSKLVGVTLEEKGIPVIHVDENGSLVTQEKVVRRLVGDQLDLFKKQTDELKSRGKY